MIVNGPIGTTRNLLSKDSFGDLEAHFEFLVPKGSNSGVKFEGLYEIQIVDSYGVAKPTASHCGGIYPRAELLPRYHYLDEGTPPQRQRREARSASGRRSTSSSAHPGSTPTARRSPTPASSRWS